MLAVLFRYSYGLTPRGHQIMVIFMTTTAALLAGVLQHMTICFLGLLPGKVLWRRARQNLSGMRQLTQLKKLHSSKICSVNLILIAHTHCTSEV